VGVDERLISEATPIPLPRNPLLTTHNHVAQPLPPHKPLPPNPAPNPFPLPPAKITHDHVAQPLPLRQPPVRVRQQRVVVGGAGVLLERVPLVELLGGVGPLVDPQRALAARRLGREGREFWLGFSWLRFGSSLSTVYLRVKREGWRKAKLSAVRRRMAHQHGAARHGLVQLPQQRLRGHPLAVLRERQREARLGLLAALAPRAVERVLLVELGGRVGSGLVDGSVRGSVGGWLELSISGQLDLDTPDTLPAGRHPPCQLSSASKQPTPPKTHQLVHLRERVEAARLVGEDDGVGLEERDGVLPHAKGLRAPRLVGLEGWFGGVTVGVGWTHTPPTPSRITPNQTPADSMNNPHPRNRPRTLPRNRSSSGGTLGCGWLREMASSIACMTLGRAREREE
jgi:hypothetical protein